MAPHNTHSKLNDKFRHLSALRSVRLPADLSVGFGIFLGSGSCGWLNIAALAR